MRNMTCVLKLRKYLDLMCDFRNSGSKNPFYITLLFYTTVQAEDNNNLI